MLHSWRGVARRPPEKSSGAPQRQYIHRLLLGRAGLHLKNRFGLSHHQLRLVLEMQL